MPSILFSMKFLNSFMVSLLMRRNANPIKEMRPPLTPHQHSLAQPTV